MARHRASPVTVQRAIAALAAEGLLEPRPGRGTFVAPRPPAQAPPDLSWQAVALGAGAVEGAALHELLAVPPPGAIPLSSGYLSLDLQPLAAGRRRAGPRGAPPRRLGARPRRGARGAARLVRARGRREPARARRRRLLRRPARAGDRLPRARRARRPRPGRGAHLPGRHRRRRAPPGCASSPSPATPTACAPTCSPQAFARTGARLVYCQPLYANPHGSVLAADRRAAVLDAVAGAGAFLLEDDWARDLSAEADPPPPLAADDRRRPRRLRALADQVGRARPARGRHRRPRRGRSAPARRAHRRRLLRRPARCRRPRWRSSPPRAGAGTAAACAPSCARAATRSSPRCERHLPALAPDHAPRRRPAPVGGAARGHRRRRAGERRGGRGRRRLPRPPVVPGRGRRGRSCA